jgi:hypothetical protein
LQTSPEKKDPQTSADGAGCVVYAGKGGPDFSVYVGGQVSRTGHEESYWANPFNAAYRRGEITLEESLEKYERYLYHELLSTEEGRLHFDDLSAAVLKYDVPLGCWCAGKKVDGEKVPEVLTKKGPLYCHGQILLRAIEGWRPPSERRGGE